MSEVKTNKLTAATGTAITLGDSGDTFTVPSGATLAVASGATITNSGTATGFGGDNTPAWQVYLSATQTPPDDAFAKVACNSVLYDTDGGYDETTNYRYTIPSGEGGKYFIYGQIQMYSTAGGDTQVQGYLQIRLNGTSVAHNQWYANVKGKTYSPNLSWVFDLSAGDYLEMWGVSNVSPNNDTQRWTGGTAPLATTWGGWKLIGV